MSMQRLMTHSANVERPTTVSGPSMGQVKTFKLIVAGTPCRIQPHTSRPTDAFAVSSNDIHSRLHFCPPVYVKRDDRITVSDGPAGVGDVYEVLGSFDPDNLGRWTVAFCRLYKGIG